MIRLKKPSCMSGRGKSKNRKSGKGKKMESSISVIAVGRGVGENYALCGRGRRGGGSLSRLIKRKLVARREKGRRESDFGEGGRTRLKRGKRAKRRERTTQMKSY